MKHDNNIDLTLLNKGIGDLTQLQHKGWDLLKEEISLPVAVVYQRRLLQNLQWMQSFADRSKVKLAPHGKTTMTPYFFHQQINAGAWAITLATVPQVIAAAYHGVERIILANQLVGKYHMQCVAELISQHNTKLEFYCLVDSIENVHQLGEFFNSQNCKLKLLIEIGVNGGRCGCRSQQDVIDLAKVINQYDSLSLAGIEVYEGVIHGDDAALKISKFLNDVLDITEQLIDENLFNQQTVILTGAGSAWYDLVAMAFTQLHINPRITPVIRPGCYLIHDEGIYQEAQQKVLERGGIACEISSELVSSLEVWAYVVSIPEPGKVIIGMGKRDVAFDAGLPQPSLYYRPGSEGVQQADNRWKIMSIMDQHAFMQVPLNAELAVGDIISFSTSHPCLTMDKWRNICIVDDNYIVREHVSTFF